MRCRNRPYRKRLRILRTRFTCVCSIAERAASAHDLRQSAVETRARRVRRVEAGDQGNRVSVGPKRGRGSDRLRGNPVVGSASGRHRSIIRRHPQVAVRVVHLNTEFLEFQVLQERAVDVVIARIPRSYTNDDLDIKSLFTDTLLVIVGAQSVWASWHKVALSEP